MYLLGASGGYVLSYLYHPVLARWLTVSEYGDLQALLSMLVIAIAPMSAWTTVAAMHVAQQAREGEHVPSTFRKALLWWTVAAVAAIALSAIPLAHRLELQSIGLLYVLAVCVALNALTSFGQALLQGQGRFVSLSASGLTLALVRLLCSVALVMAGFGVLGAAAGIAGAYLVTVAYLHTRTRMLSAVRAAPARERTGQVAGAGRVVALAAAAGSVVAFAHVDAVLAKTFFDPLDAGAYSGIAALGRIILYGTSSVAAVLVASLRPGAAAAHNRRLTLTAVACTAAIGGAVLIAFAVVPEWIVGASIGSRYRPWAPLLPRVGLVVLTLSLANVFVVYFVGVQQSRTVAAPVIVSTGAAFVACALGHETLHQMISALLASSALLLVWLVWLFVTRTTAGATGETRSGT